MEQVKVIQFVGYCDKCLQLATLIKKRVPTNLVRSQWFLNLPSNQTWCNINVVNPCTENKYLASVLLSNSFPSVTNIIFSLVYIILTNPV